MPFCPKCGSKVPEDAQYCPNCGAPIGKPEPPTVQPVPTAAEAPPTRGLFERVYRAAMLDPLLYDEVEADEAATTQALAVVVIASISQGIGSALSHGLRGFFGGLVSALVAWLLWSFITYLVGTRVFDGRATYGELLRTIGFAHSPNLLAILTFIPFLGGLISFALWVWGLVAMIVAVRQALDFSTGKAVMTCIVGFIAAMLVLVIAAFFLAIPLILFNIL